MKPAILTPLGASVFEQTTPRLATPASGQDSNGSGRLFQPFAMSSAHARPGWQTPPPLIKCALRPRSTEFMRFPRRRLALWRWPALAQSLLRSVCPVLLTHRWTTAPMFRLSGLVLTPPLRSQTTPPVSLAASLRSTTLLLPRRSR